MKFTAPAKCIALYLFSASLSAQETVIIIEKVPERIVVHQGPPADIEEIVPVTPWVDRTWIKGHWRWDQNRWVWQRGRLAINPHENAIWVSGHWIKNSDQWVWVYGYWK